LKSSEFNPSGPVAFLSFIDFKLYFSSLLVISSISRGNVIADELTSGGSVLGFLGPEPTLGASRRDVQKKGLVIGWSTSIGQGGETLVTPEGRLEN